MTLGWLDLTHVSGEKSDNVTDRGKAALILTHNRQGLLLNAIEAITPQVDRVLVIDNASDPPALVPDGVDLAFIPDQPPNLSRLWNFGLDYFAGFYGDCAWDAAVLCDDTVVPAGWFDAVTQAMRTTGATVGCSNPWGIPHAPKVKRHPDSDIAGRMIGWAFVIDGTTGLRADETMTFWYLDTDLDFQARKLGGFVMVGGYPVPNVHPGGFTATGRYNGQIEQDRNAFAAKWGYLPW